MIRAWFEEYRSIRGNQGALLILFGAVFIYSFYYPVPYLNEILREVPLAVVDNDCSPLSRQFIRMTDATEYIRVASKPSTMEQAKEEFYQRKVLGILFIPQDFQRCVKRGDGTRLAAYYDTGNFFVYRQLRSGITYVSRTLGAGIQIKRFQAAGQSAQRAFAAQDPLPLLTVPLFNPSSNYGAYAIPAVFCLLIQQSLLIGIGMVSGVTNERVYALGGIRPDFLETLKIVLGRAAAYVSIAILTSLYLLAMIHLYYRYPMHVLPLELLLFSQPYLLSCTFLGITLGPLFRSREVPVLACLFTSMPFIFFCGFVWPPEAFPYWLRIITYAVPASLGVEGFVKLSQMGAPLRDVGFNYNVLWMLSGIYFITACIATRFSRMPDTTNIPIPVTAKAFNSTA